MSLFADNGNVFFYSFCSDLEWDPHGSPGTTLSLRPLSGMGDASFNSTPLTRAVFDSALSGVECACAVDDAGSRAKAYVHQFTSTVLLVPQTILRGKEVLPIAEFCCFLSLSSQMS
ncbi:hypothetical protein CEXT_802011 [Caerostris extrusa]|uniref:Uncharacterized protein n=1 Tax=Caerostris extrusa TaxID=172846 RepID=A0AAV4PSE8_CAEEX|nr:hypothetical protein CEXT_802011 [Caerostris extrusa]